MRITGVFDRHVATFILTVGLVVWIEAFISVEWTYPYCIHPDNGSAYAVFGMPFPYYTFSGISSLQTAIWFHIYFLNIFLLSILSFPFISMILTFTASKVKHAMEIASVAGLLLIFSMTSIQGFMTYNDMRYFTNTLLVSGSYWDLRPISIRGGTSGLQPCKPSSYWFPDKK